jgi:thiamine-phosphate pyrophosphorylase
VESPRFLLITDPRFADEHVLAVVEHVSNVFPKGSFAVQLRDKTREPQARAAFAWRLRELTHELRVPLVINGDHALALLVGADGFHAPLPLVPHDSALWRSIPAHSDEDVTRGCEAGVDAMLVSPIFETPGKGPPRGVAALMRAHHLARGRSAVLALGGIDAASSPACFAALADGVAVVRALLGAPDPGAVARALCGAKTEAARSGCTTLG